MKLNLLANRNVNYSDRVYPQNSNSLRAKNNFNSLSFQGFKAPYSQLKSDSFTNKIFDIIYYGGGKISVKEQARRAKWFFSACLDGCTFFTIRLARKEENIMSESMNFVRMKLGKLCDHYQADSGTRKGYLDSVNNLYKMFENLNFTNFQKTSMKIVEALPGGAYASQLTRERTILNTYNQMLERGIENPKDLSQSEILSIMEEHKPKDPIIAINTSYNKIKECFMSQPKQRK
jgi:hypothetical protein